MDNETYSIAQVAKIMNAKAVLVNPELKIKKLLTDSRTIAAPDEGLFFAVKAQRNGHDFIDGAYQNGVRNFVVSEKGFTEKYADVNVLFVPNVLAALQHLAQYHRSRFNLKTIGITGSTGKSMVKEWLYQLLATDYNIVRSPKSYNSQIGVPLSVWQITENHNLGIFEAGISTANEMQALHDMIKPDIGILTNIGTQHDEGFDNRTEKIKEKLKLFENAKLLIYNPGYVKGIDMENLSIEQSFTWSTENAADLQVFERLNKNETTYLKAHYKSKQIELTIPFTDSASVENAIICWAVLLALGYENTLISERLTRLSPVVLQLQLLNGINQCSIIHDHYSTDISSLAIALDFLNQQNQHNRKTLILSDLNPEGKETAQVYQEVATLLKHKHAGRLIGIGPEISSFANLFDKSSLYFETIEELIAKLPEINFNNETILLKGQDRFGFAALGKLLTQKVHDTVLEINLNALVKNLQFYRAQLKPGVKTMAMVKAFSYGSGSFEIANLLQYHKVDYLAVAYADEGIALRKAGITLPIMVMSPEVSAFEAIVKYNLEPEIYSTEVLTDFIKALPANVQHFPIHIKVDTGMHRLGFEQQDLKSLMQILTHNHKIKVVSVFTHLAGADETLHDDFTQMQVQKYLAFYHELLTVLPDQPIRHVLNTSGISRHANTQFDMVRIGIGMYGFDAALPKSKGLETVACLKTTISQIKALKAGETVGYSRRGVLSHGGKIATVKIGYADGYNRNFGNGTGKMLVNGHLSPTVGSICMDMCMLDITGIEAKVGDEVIVFNHEHTIADLANAIETIPYEILTNVSQRVKRVYLYG
ncbi:bifunctional UDP-N-acetylmuramoyl-tripeptide:D-alanyl-D-alanine ligase/alanine racemase [Pedobacter sp. CYS-01]|uniref:Alanine racemase n=2 Tax=Pedobacter montanisoli TaxID=2923277 RepID=A0ABS9ZWN4_9SPHI|nr:bifunctional UDP-N-acetylmuramoyl-tripeptide:D-alanyl-D-alanine ligase/alanine racemase [Pedobacter montanisoli]MCJ0742721.1 bifunctional UDP-N-acetylmuramoyl-tripeptide:D-alanyl-D-alanine ligase/alanine racemase [Pedobacter montanisoli]